MSDGRDPRTAPSHRRFEELAAGYALDALEEADKALFVEHLRVCESCGQDVAELHVIAAMLAESASSCEAPPGLREKILSSLGATPPGFGLLAPEPLPRSSTALQQTDRIVPTRAHRPRRQRIFLAAAAAVLALGGIVGGFFAAGNGLGSPPAHCDASSECVTITLTSALSRAPAAQVIVSGTKVWVRSTGLRPDDTAQQIYVLWSIHGHEPPRPIGGFDVPRGGHVAVPVGVLSARPKRHTEFAISLEHGRTVPRKPSDIVATERT